MLTKHYFWADFFENATFGLQTLKQTGTYCCYTLTESFQSNILVHFCLFGSLWSNSLQFGPLRSIWSARSISVHSFYFCSVWSFSVYFGPLKSILVHFDPIWSYSVHYGLLRSIQSTLVYFVPFGILWSNSVHYDLFRFTSVHSVHFSDALSGDVCVERGTTSLTNMSHFQNNVGKFLIKLYFSYVIIVLFFILF